MSRPEPLIVHDLPKAPKMMGRQDLLAQLHQFLDTGSGVVSLLGLGGAGKTTIISKALEQVFAENQFDGILVWSFYDDPDTNAFLQTAVNYFGSEAQVTGQGSGWFYLLKRALDSDEKFLIILDGLERVQRPVTDAQGVYGEIEDPLLRGILIRLASASSNAKAIITSRFTISDLEKWSDHGFTTLVVDELESDAAVSLLKAHGVTGTDGEMLEAVEKCGHHALTIDLLGSATKRFFEGHLDRLFSELGLENGDGEVRSNRLKSVLQLFESHLPPVELDLLSRLCVFRFGVTISALESVFQSGDDSVSGAIVGLSSQELGDLVRNLVALHLVHQEGTEKFSVHPAVRDHFYARFRDVSKVHGAISDHYTTLVSRPGVGLPTSKAALDLLEELVHHALRSGAEDQALEIFCYRMGGGEHLSIKLGEYGRTFRILSAFQEIPEPGSMYLCLRAFGRFDAALKWRPQNRYIRMITGALRELRDDANNNTSRIARLLRAESNLVPERAPDHPLCPAVLHLLVDQLDAAQASAKRELETSIHQDDVIRNQLALAECYRRRKQLDRAAAELASASDWIMQSGSAEHLALLFLFRALLERDMGKEKEARSSLDESIQMCLDSNFVLIEIEGRIARAMLLQDSDPERAVGEATQARDLAAHEDRSYIWGQMRALNVLEPLLRKLGRNEQADQAKAELEHLESRVEFLRGPSSLKK